MADGLTLTTCGCSGSAEEEASWWLSVRSLTDGFDITLYADIHVNASPLPQPFPFISEVLFPEFLLNPAELSPVTAEQNSFRSEA